MALQTPLEINVGIGDIDILKSLSHCQRSQEGM